MKQKPSFKRAKKSPVVSVIVEHIAPPAPPSPPPVAPSQVAQESKELRLETAKTIAETLHETKDGVRGQIYLIVKRLGSEEALTLLKQAEEVEANGGMMLPDGSRRRTPGGVFFYLTRTRYPEFDFQQELKVKMEQKRERAQEKKRMSTESTGSSVATGETSSGEHGA